MEESRKFHMDKLCQPKKGGGPSLPNIKYYSISSEMAKLARDWDGTDSEVDWILIEWQLTSPFKPIEVLAQISKKESII